MDVKTKKSSITSPSEGDDEESVIYHLNELEKESRKKDPDQDKLARLMLLTYINRRNTFMAQTANTCISDAISKYLCKCIIVFID